MLPTYQHILYATDLSASARLALRHAVSLAQCHGAAMTILHVVPDIVDLMSENAGFDIESHFDTVSWKEFNASATSSAREKARVRVREIAAECATNTPDCPVARAQIIIRSGDPATHILHEIPGHDLVVMGAHGRGAFADILLGSVASKVVRLSPIPVLTVRLPEEPV